MTVSRRRTSVIDKALALLTELQVAEGAVRLTELSRKTGLAKSTTHRMLSALLASGVVTRVGSCYQASGRGDTVNAPGVHATLLRGLAPFTGDVLIRTGLTASLAVLQGTSVVFAHRVHGHDGVWSPSDETGKECAYGTAAGHLLMAYDHAAARHIIDMFGLEPDETAVLHHDLARIRQERFARKQRQPGVTCLAVPMLGVHGYPRVALTIKGKNINQERVLHQLRWIASSADRKILGPMRPLGAIRPRDVRRSA